MSASFLSPCLFPAEAPISSGALLHQSLNLGSHPSTIHSFTVETLVFALVFHLACAPISSSYPTLLKKLPKFYHISFTTAWTNDWLTFTFILPWNCSQHSFSTCWIAKYNGCFSALTFLDLFVAYYNIDHLTFFPVLNSSLPLWMLQILLINFVLLSPTSILVHQSLLFSFSLPLPYPSSLIHFFLGVFFLPNNYRILSIH